jgi:short-subunit dehydrogenase
VTVRGKVCVVTGASSGIGEATARFLGRAGATVVVAARREDRLEALARSIGERATWARCDVTSLRDIEALRRHVDREHGRCDVLVNNAGIPGGGRFEELTLEQIDRVTDVNYRSVLLSSKVFLPMLLASGGHLVNVASLAGRYALPGAPAYTAAKHAVVAFGESLYHELRPRGVMVTSVNPGLVETEGFPMTELKRDPLARRFIMRPERVAREILRVIRERKGPEVSVPRWLAAPQAFRVLTPPLYRAAVRSLVDNRAARDPAPT